MKGLRLLKGAALGLAALGMILPPGQARAASKDLPARKAPAPVVNDITMTGGKLTGRVINAQGKAVDGATVTLRQGKNEVAKLVTDKDGGFAASNLRGGVYEIAAGQSTGVIRVWSEKTAPPSAKTQVMLVSDPNNAVRGQDPYYYGVDPATVLIIAGVITGVVLGAVAVSQNADIKDRLDQIPTSP